MTHEPIDLEALTDLIEQRHHAYVRDHIVPVAQQLEELVRTSGATHPTLPVIALRFAALGQELTMHLAKEEHILFPYVRALARAARDGHRGPASPFGTVRNPIRMMEVDHEHTTGVIDELRRLTDGYETPADAPDGYDTCMTALAEFDTDLREHIHLEGAVLFPRALDLEDRLASV